MANITDKITDVRNAARPNSARVSTARSPAGSNLACNDLTGWPTASKVHFVTYQIDSNSNPVANSQLDCYGIVSGSTITSMTIVDGTDAGNSVGDVVEMLPTAAWGQDLADALTSTHNRAGGLKSSLTITTPTLSVPVISDFTSATHNHSTNSKGGQLGLTAIDWSTFSLNMKSANNPSQINPGNSDQDLAANGVTISFTVSSNCNALVTVSIGCSSTSDFEFQIEIRKAGTTVSSFIPTAAAGNASNRATVRGYTAVIPLTTGANVLSAGLLLSSSTGGLIQGGAATIAAIVLGNVTA